MSQSAFVPQNLVSRDGFGSPVPRQPAHIYTQAESGGRPLLLFVPPYSYIHTNVSCLQLVYTAVLLRTYKRFWFTLYVCVVISLILDVRLVDARHYFNDCVQQLLKNCGSIRSALTRTTVEIIGPKSEDSRQ